MTKSQTKKWVHELDKMNPEQLAHIMAFIFQKLMKEAAQ